MNENDEMDNEETYKLQSKFSSFDMTLIYKQLNHLWQNLGLIVDMCK